MAKARPKEKPTCQFNNEWSDGVSNSLDDIFEILEDILAEIQGNAPVIPELAKAIAKNAVLARIIDLQVPDKKHKPKKG